MTWVGELWTERIDGRKGLGRLDSGMEGEVYLMCIYQGGVAAGKHRIWSSL